MLLVMNPNQEHFIVQGEIYIFKALNRIKNEHFLDEVPTKCKILEGQQVFPGMRK